MKVGERCRGEIPGEGKTMIQRAMVETCSDCYAKLLERFKLVVEGWYGDPVTKEEIEGYAKLAVEHAEKGDRDGWEQAMRDYAKAVIYRERDDLPEVCLAGMMRGLSIGAGNVAFEEGLEQAATLCDRWNATALADLIRRLKPSQQALS